MRVSFRIPPGRVAVAMAMLLALSSLPAEAQTRRSTAKPESKQSLQQEVDQLKRDVERLKRANQAIEPMVDEKFNKQYVTAGFNLKDGFFIQDPSKTYRLRFGGYTQFDGRFFIDDGDQSTDQFLFRRVRPILSGSLTKYVDFRIMPDFAGSSVQLFDAYVDIKPFDYYRDWLKVRVGKYKPNLGLERLQSATAISLVERAAPSNLVPTRDLGITLWGAPWTGLVGYELGVFDGAPDAGNINGDINDAFSFSGRVYTQPFINWPADSALAPVRDLFLGMAGSWGRHRGSLTSTDLPAYRSFSQSTIFQYVNGGDAANTAFADGIQSRFNPQAYWFWGPFGAMFEYVESTTPVKLGDIQDGVANRAWMVQGNWMVTGDDASYRGVSWNGIAEPKNPFNPLAGKWGAVELVVRADQLEIDKDAFRLGFANPARSVNEATGFGGGVNWYWSRNIKLALDYYHTYFDGGKQGGTGNRNTEDVIIARLQLVL